MSILSKNLTRRLHEMGKNVPFVVGELNKRGMEVAYSTVAAWFNGHRRPRDMEHLKALCEVLQTTISEMAGEDPSFAQNKMEQVLLENVRKLRPEQIEAIVATVVTMLPYQGGGQKR